MSRTTLKQFKEKAFQNSKVQEEYDLLKPEYAIKKNLIGKGVWVCQEGVTTKVI